MANDQPLFILEGLTKSYPGVIANQDVSFDIEPHSIHALLGENGAGKSTLVKMIYGLVQADQGRMTYQGQPFAPDRPQQARNAGIGMVFQHFSLFEAMNVAENIALGMDEPQDLTELSVRVRAVSGQYGLPLDPDAIVGDLSAGERQRVEIIRCLLVNPKLLIMDEPTSVLTPQEVDKLFESLRRLRDEGTSILYISHKLDEILALCDQATILRRGQVVGECDPRTHSANELAHMMVGDIKTESLPRDHQAGDVKLDIQEASMPPSNAFGVSLKSITLAAHSGEVLGIAGVAGNGQDELFSLISGERMAKSGRVNLHGQELDSIRPEQRRMMGIISAPEERLGHAAVPQMNLIENSVLTAQKRASLGTGNWIDWKAADRFAQEVIDKYDVRTPGTHVNAAALSGGNLQKFVVGREILQNPEVLIINQPTWGVDIAAARFIRARLIELASQGVAVIIISQDLDELFEISDRMMVLCEGRLSPACAVSDVDVEQIGVMMGGQF